MLRVGQDSQSVKLEFGDSEERVRSSELLVFLRLLNLAVLTGFSTFKEAQDRKRNVPMHRLG